MDDREAAIREKYKDLEVMSDEWIRIRIRPTTFDEVEYSITTRGVANFARDPFRRARDEIEQLIGEGWTDHGWFQNSLMGSLVYPNDSLRLLAIQMKERGLPHRLVGYYFNDDDTRTHLLTPPVEKDQPST